MKNYGRAGAERGRRAMGVRWLAGPDTAHSVPRVLPVRFPPLGSPWLTSKQLLSTAEYVVRVVRTGWVRGRGTTRGGYWVGTGRVLYRYPGPTVPGPIFSYI